jgi:hypothetical protein
MDKYTLVIDGNRTEFRLPQNTRMNVVFYIADETPLSRYADWLPNPPTRVFETLCNLDDLKRIMTIISSPGVRDRYNDTIHVQLGVSMINVHNPQSTISIAATDHEEDIDITDDFVCSLIVNDETVVERMDGMAYRGHVNRTVPYINIELGPNQTQTTFLRTRELGPRLPTNSREAPHRRASNSNSHMRSTNSHGDKHRRVMPWDGATTSSNKRFRVI